MKSLYIYFKKIPALFLTGLFLLYSGCFDDDKKEAAQRLADDLARIDQYLDEHGIDKDHVLQDPAGKIRYVIDTAGTTGVSPLPNEGCITARYIGRYLEDSTEFTKTTGSSYPMAGDLLEVWKIVLPLLQQDDKAIIFLPSGLAYGPTGLPLQNIPPNAIVFFEFKLLRVGKTYSPTPSPTGSCQ